MENQPGLWEVSETNIELFKMEFETSAALWNKIADIVTGENDLTPAQIIFWTERGLEATDTLRRRAAMLKSWAEQHQREQAAIIPYRNAHLN